LQANRKRKALYRWEYPGIAEFLSDHFEEIVQRTRNVVPSSASKQVWYATAGDEAINLLARYRHHYRTLPKIEEVIPEAKEFAVKKLKEMRIFDDN
jgi:hypothetical protein